MFGGEGGICFVGPPLTIRTPQDYRTRTYLQHPIRLDGAFCGFRDAQQPEHNLVGDIVYPSGAYRK